MSKSLKQMTRLELENYALQQQQRAMWHEMNNTALTQITLQEYHTEYHARFQKFQGLVFQLGNALVEIDTAATLCRDNRMLTAALAKSAGIITGILGDLRVRGYGVDDETMKGIAARLNGLSILIQQNDGGAALREAIRLYPRGKAMPELREALNEMDFGGRPKGMIPERQILAHLANAHKKQYGGNWWVIGKRIVEDLVATERRTPEQDGALDLLRGYFSRDLNEVTDKTGLRRYLSDLVGDFKKCR